LLWSPKVKLTLIFLRGLAAEAPGGVSVGGVSAAVIIGRDIGGLSSITELASSRLEQAQMRKTKTRNLGKMRPMGEWRGGGRRRFGLISFAHDVKDQIHGLAGETMGRVLGRLERIDDGGEQREADL
jgi:hypothetical protein